MFSLPLCMLTRLRFAGTTHEGFMAEHRPTVGNYFTEPDKDRFRSTSHVLWDTDMSELLQGQSAQLCQTSIHTPYLPFIPHSRICHHLPLVRNSVYTSGFTVYYSKDGIRGMKSYFHTSSSVLVGEEKGYPLHFALAAGEYITSAWVNMRFRHAEPYANQAQCHSTVVMVSTIRRCMPLCMLSSLDARTLLIP